MYKYHNYWYQQCAPWNNYGKHWVTSVELVSESECVDLNSEEFAIVFEEL